MRAQVRARGPDDPDEFWLVEHDPVYTLGQAGREAHIHAPGAIPVVRSDRGGQVTYHGPGQIVLYLLLDLRRLGLGARELVRRIEAGVVSLTNGYGIEAAARADAPGVYVDGAKLAALGLRISRGFSYHGLALNLDMDLEPFERIDPCGYPGLRATQLRDLGVAASWEEIAQRLCGCLIDTLGYTSGSVNQQSPT
jgi:lipoyl(octanoyl) transferase